MADLATIEDLLPELEDRIGVTERRVARLHAVRQRMERAGEDTIRVDFQLRNLERALAAWRAQRQAWR
jgi:hypothetical protein